MAQDELIKDLRRRMDGAIEVLRKEFGGLRTGRANASLLDPIMVMAYGNPMPLNQLASLSVPEPTLIVASPFDPSQMGTIEKAIRNANLGLNPHNDGKVIRIPIPPLTDERRKELSKLVHKLAEDGRNAVRQIRREINDALKKLLKEHKISEDEERRSLDEIQKITDQFIHQIDELQTAKDSELLKH